MKLKMIGLLLFAVLLLASGAMAYSGYNKYYYTNYYTPTAYYATPYNVPTTYVSTYYPTYTTYYNTGYYPTYTTYYNTSDYPTYAYATSYYYPSYSYYTPAVGTYNGLSVYKDDSGWGFSISRGSVCGIYGYC